MKRSSTSYGTGEIQLKTVRYQYTTFWMSKIQNTDNTKCWQRCGMTETFIIAVEKKNDTVFGRKSGSFL